MQDISTFRNSEDATFLDGTINMILCKYEHTINDLCMFVHFPLMQNVAKFAKNAFALADRLNT